MMSFAIALACSFLVTAWGSSIQPHELNWATPHIADCKGKCDGEWAQWTGWGECADSECHLTYGKQTRQTDCYIMVTAPPSRRDGGASDAEKPSPEWKLSCRQIEMQQCVQARTCDGEWGKWGSWTDCEKMSSGSQCNRSKRRLCKDIRNKRLPGSHCYGGTRNDTFEQACGNEECGDIYEMPLQSDRTILQVKSPEDEQDEPKISQSTILIIAVVVGSVVFGSMFVLLLLNVTRRSSGNRDDDSNSSQSDRWKRIGSLNTSSTVCSAGYVTASDVMSPRLDIRDLQSPAGSTTGSGSSSLQMQFFGRSEVRSPSEVVAAAPLLTVSGGLNVKEERPRRSRLLQENIYWEITENNSPESVSEATSDAANTERSSSPDENRQLVDNVLYGSRV